MKVTVNRVKYIQNKKTDTVKTNWESVEGENWSLTYNDSNTDQVFHSYFSYSSSLQKTDWEHLVYKLTDTHLFMMGGGKVPI